jgi:hypothetical protein
MSTTWFEVAETERVAVATTPESGPEGKQRVSGVRRSPRTACGSQLDLAMPTPPPAVRRRLVVRPCSRERAAWWFEQMRRAVDEGREIPVSRTR